MNVTVVDGRTVTLAGRLDASTVGDARNALHAALQLDSGVFDLDVSAVEIGDATGLGLLVGLHRGAERRERRLVLHGVPPKLMRMLRATRLLRILHIASTSLVAAEEESHLAVRAG